ncbi:MAG: hypothetical protein PVF22_07275, partial [Candidatus Aminicenantes bacterium]
LQERLNPREKIVKFLTACFDVSFLTHIDHLRRTAIVSFVPFGYAFFLSYFPKKIHSIRKRGQAFILKERGRSLFCLT